MQWFTVFNSKGVRIGKIHCAKSDLFALGVPVHFDRDGVTIF